MITAVKLFNDHRSSQQLRRAIGLKIERRLHAIWAGRESWPAPVPAGLLPILGSAPQQPCEPVGYSFFRSWLARFLGLNRNRRRHQLARWLSVSKAFKRLD